MCKVSTNSIFLPVRKDNNNFDTFYITKCFTAIYCMVIMATLERSGVFRSGSRLERARSDLMDEGEGAKAQGGRGGAAGRC